MSTDTDGKSIAELYAETNGIQRELLAQAERRLATLSPDNPLWDRAEQQVSTLERQVAESEQRMAEAMTTSEATEGVDVIEANTRRLDTLRREFRDRRNQYEAQLAADGRYTAEYRAELMQAWDAEQQAEAEQAARVAWRAYKSAEQAMARDMQVAHRDNEARFDLPSVGVLVKDYGAQLQAPPIPQGMTDDRTHRLRFVAQLLDRAEASGDPNAQRAARIAAAPEVRRMMTTADGEAGRLSRELHQRLGRMAEAERGRVVEIEQRQAALQRRGEGLRVSILGLEQATTGKAGGMFGVSPWQASVLGEGIESMGGGVSAGVDR